MGPGRERALEGVSTSDAGWDPPLDLNEDLRVDDVDVEIESALVQVHAGWVVDPAE
jgi:hypothetical protein